MATVSDPSALVAVQNPVEDVTTHMARVPTQQTTAPAPDSQEALEAARQRRTTVFLGLTVVAVLWLTTFA